MRLSRTMGRSRLSGAGLGIIGVGLGFVRAQGPAPARVARGRRDAQLRGRAIAVERLQELVPGARVAALDRRAREHALDRGPDVARRLLAARERAQHVLQPRLEEL